jgi:hypothetical protein
VSNLLSLGFGVPADVGGDYGRLNRNLWRVSLEVNTLIPNTDVPFLDCFPRIDRLDRLEALQYIRLSLILEILSK